MKKIIASIAIVGAFALTGCDSEKDATAAAGNDPFGISSERPEGINQDAWDDTAKLCGALRSGEVTVETAVIAYALDMEGKTYTSGQKGEAIAAHIVAECPEYTDDLLDLANKYGSDDTDTEGTSL